VRDPAAADQAPELTRVQLSGSYLADRSVPVRATLPATRGAPASGIGFFWMTPFSVDGAVVFINRGFVPSGGDFRPPVIATPEGPRTITGLLRLPEQRRFFTAADDPARQEFSIRDPKAMAAAVGLDPAAVAPFFIDAERSPGDATPPVGIDARELIARIPNNHLQYALTWFGLALTLVGVFAAFVRQRLKGTT
jgi:surfeit locus 1 family protein